VFFFGNLPTENHLAFLETNFLSRFEGNKGERVLTVPSVHPMPRWQSPRRVVKAYPAGEGETLERGASVTLNWLLGTVTDPFHVVSFEVLTEVLLGHAGSPLQKALIESGLGEDLSPATGLETEALEVAFSVGLRGTSPQKEKAIEELVFTVLGNLVSQGIDREFIEGALRRVEFRNREVKAGAAFGMRLMRRALRGWIHGEPPERTLEFQKWMEVLKETVQKDPRYFEGLIERYFIQNSHRTTLVVVPDPDLERKMQEAIRNRLEQEYGSLTPAERKALEEDIRRFREFQERPDPEEALARIPSLSLEEVPPIFDRIPAVPLSLPGIREGYAHDLFTNGIVYLDFAIDLEGTEEGPYLFLPLYTAVLTGIGAGGKPYDRIALDLQIKTGGFSTSLEAGTLTGGGQHVRQFLFLRLKTLEEQVEEGLELVRNLLLEPDLEDTSRLEDLLLEYRNDLKSSIIPDGSTYVASRAERGISRAERKEELWKGISQFLFVHSLRGKVAVERLANRLHQIKTALLCQNRMYVNITCPQDRWAAILPKIEKFVSFFPPSDGAPFKTRSVKERYREEPVPRFE
ncbi:MAG TPA: insulinase family protein, partial [Spirochaetales bacterium]|nr:insulinase family protein [Spirochaetales bacterium]